MELLLEKKVRKIKNVENILKMNLKKLPKVLHMFHANDKDGAEEWIADIRQAFPEMDFKLYPLPISFAVHAGEGTIAIVIKVKPVNNSRVLFNKMKCDLDISPSRLENDGRATFS